MTVPENVEMLVDEYRTLLNDALKEETEFSGDNDKIRNVLVRNGDWTPRAAEHLMAIVKNYGSFMLRNALAISLVLGIEDGELGF